MRNLNAITPETETTSHYFWGQAHDFDVKNPEMTERVFQQIQMAFLEDVAVFTAQQRMITMRPDAPQVDINADAGGIQARRIVDRLYRAEQAQLAASVAAE
jgi:vanillate O-demethylase monooxygenase subunit